MGSDGFRQRDIDGGLGIPERSGQTPLDLAAVDESLRRLGRSRRIAPAAESDVFLIANTGAYGRVMSSRYNLREPAVERLLPPRT